MNAYTALWSRLERFEPKRLAKLLEERQVVRIAVMRATIHLVSAEDCLVLRPLSCNRCSTPSSRATASTDTWLASSTSSQCSRLPEPLLADRPRTGPELRAALAEAFPDDDATALAYACRNHLALVQVPPRGIWGLTAQVASTTAEAWLGLPLATSASLDHVVLRYLAAFGPASVADVATWSRLTRLREVVERLRPQLRLFRDEKGRELFDLPDAPRPDPDTPAPTRFLPEYDNVLLSHGDRSRFYADRARLSAVTGPVHGTVLSDGVVCAVWRIERDTSAGQAVLMISKVVRLTKRATAAVVAEGHRFLRFAAADAAHDVRFSSVE